MQIKRFKLQIFTVILCACGVFAVSSPGFTDEANQSLKLPEDLAEKATQGVPPKYEIEERRIGDRLDRITVRREDGIDETYENTEVDSLWGTADKELGETQNLRRWTIGTW
ncbi:MAG: hypothetical protein KTR18_12130 [Acidiferrobacterales bacterium]|nr:hypothetical protein [Acidiferrobacterales bacterium]